MTGPPHPLPLTGGKKPPPSGSINGAGESRTYRNSSVGKIKYSCIVKGVGFVVNSMQGRSGVWDIHR